MYYQFHNDGPVFEQKGQTMHALTSITGHCLTVSTVDFPLPSPKIHAISAWRGPLHDDAVQRISTEQHQRSVAYDKQIKQNSEVTRSARELAMQQSRERIDQNRRNARKTTRIGGRNANL